MIFGLKLKLKELLSLTLLLVIMISIPLGVYLIQREQTLKSHASLEFSVGFNTAGIIHYGYGDLLKYSSSADIDADLSEINKMGGKIVRVFVGNDNVTNEEAARRLDSFLSKAASYNISVIASFINFYGDNGFRPQGTQKYYTDSWNNIPLLNHEFFNSGYQNEYKSFVNTVVSYNKGHANIYAWEPGNELKDNSSSQTFINFMKDITATIKNIDPAHQIATGMINSAHASLLPDQLYSVLPNVDIVTIHTYGGSREGLADVNWALSHNKIVINEEMGISGSGNRADILRGEIDFWKSQGVTAVLQWGFLAKGLGDNGNGDGTWGMDTVWHTDYDQLFILYSAYNRTTSVTPTVSLTKTPSPTSVITPTKTSQNFPTDFPTQIPTQTEEEPLPTTSSTLPSPTFPSTKSPSPTTVPARRPTTSLSLSTTTAPLAPTLVKFDLNSDNVINTMDVGVLLEAWRKRLAQEIKKVDFNGDGVINSLDYSLLIRNFRL